VAWHQLLNRYGSTFDLGDAAAWADCFEVDGAFVSVTGVVYHGQAPLAANAAGLQRKWRAQELLVAA
jgi:hypothetical protein